MKDNRRNIIQASGKPIGDYPILIAETMVIREGNRATARMNMFNIIVETDSKWLIIHYKIYMEQRRSISVGKSENLSLLVSTTEKIYRPKLHSCRTIQTYFSTYSTRYYHCNDNNGAVIPVYVNITVTSLYVVLTVCKNFHYQQASTRRLIFSLCRSNLLTYGTILSICSYRPF